MKKLLFVLGCGRSGTSVLTRILVANGYDAPHLSSSHAEDSRVCAINDALLCDNGCKWHEAKKPVKNISKDIRRQIKSITEEYDGFPNPLLKCPRMVFCLPAWLPFVEKPSFIGIFRKEYEVAESLVRRHPELTIEQGIDYWYNHNRQLMKLVNKFDFPVLDLNSPRFLEDAKAVFKSHLGIKKFNGDAFKPEAITGTGK